MTGKLFVTGMVRSGTSLISRALDAHPQIVCALDPCLGFFRSLRNELMNRNGGCPDPEGPFTDFFFAPPPGLKMYLEANLRLPVAFEPVEVTKERMRYFNRDSNAPLLVPSLDQLGGEKTYAELLEAILGLLQEVYGAKETRWTGFVQTWVEVFAPILMNTWPDMVCVHILRDPRAVIASWCRTVDLTHDYPFLMILRHWRKSAALAGLVSRMFPENYLVLRYEDFVRDPGGELGKICQRLGLAFDPAMTQVVSFKSGAGERWQSNTSYETPAEISSKFVERWRERLTDADLRYIEDACGPEMCRWNYQRVTTSGAPASLLNIPPLCRQIKGEADWISHFGAEYAHSSANLAKELFRWHVFHEDVYRQALGSRDLESVVLDPDLLST